MSSPSYPPTWPKGCPPADAQDARGTYFRIAKNNPPDPEAFKSHDELGKMPKADACLRRGLSCFPTPEGARHMTQLLPGLGKVIFRATLTPEHGKTKVTPGRLPDHTTWWPYERVDRASLFEFVEVAS